MEISDSRDGSSGVPSLPMMEVLKQRKRRQRLSIDMQATRKSTETETIRSEYMPTEMDSILPVRKSKRISKRTLFCNFLLVATCSILFRGQTHFPCINAFQSTLYLQTRASKIPSSISRFMSLATPPSSIPSRSDLESMKVVDLKQLIKDSGFNERGLLSKLKKKQDLVDLLVEKGTSSTSNVDTEQPTPTTQQQRQPRKVPMAMPKKAPTTATPAAASAENPQSMPTQKQSPMMDLFERVNKQYPTLQYLRDGNRTLYGELDIRQRYHPMLQAGNLQAIPDSEVNESGDETDEAPAKKTFKPALSGDMDLIFVGTASCTPSITRGVSCTALRLHSLASSSSTTSNTKQKKISKGKKGQPQRFDVESNQSKNLGTWLFDCGESTQVRTIYVVLISSLECQLQFCSLLCFLRSASNPKDVFGPSQQNYKNLFDPCPWGSFLWTARTLVFDGSRYCWWQRGRRAGTQWRKHSENQRFQGTHRYLRAGGIAIVAPNRDSVQCLEDCSSLSRTRTQGRGNGTRMGIQSEMGKILFQ